MSSGDRLGMWLCGAVLLSILLYVLAKNARPISEWRVEFNYHEASKS